MKKLIILTLLVTMFTVVEAKKRDTFVYSYTLTCLWDNDKSEWDEWGNYSVTVVFNADKVQGKVVIYFGGGDSIVLMPIGVLVSKRNSNGDKYQMNTYLDEDGVKIVLRLFNKGQLSIMHTTRKGVSGMLFGGIIE